MNLRQDQISVNIYRIKDELSLYQTYERFIENFLYDAPLDNSEKYMYVMKKAEMQLYSCSCDFCFDSVNLSYLPEEQRFCNIKSQSKVAIAWYDVLSYREVHFIIKSNTQ